MAKNDNLKDFLTDVADAIREKKGTAELINPQSFSDEIRAFEIGGGGGGGAVAVSPKAVNFRDYDGTILHSYTKDEFLALNEFPPLPTQKGLICQEWNWDIAEAKEYVAEYGRLEVGATYITDDGKTRLYIRIAEEGRMDVPLYFSQSIANGVTIDWGDGSKATLSGTGFINTSHHYDAVGDYVIKLEVAEGCNLVLGYQNLSDYSVMGQGSGKGQIYNRMLYRVEIGKNVKYTNNYTFQKTNITTITIPKGVLNISAYSFYTCCLLKSIVIPKGVVNLYGFFLQECRSLTSVIFPQEITQLYNSAFNNCQSLASVTLSKGLTSIPGYAFYYCYSLTSITIPQGVTSIGEYAFQGCLSLTSVTIPQGVTSIGQGAFLANLNMVLYDFRSASSVPTLSNSNAFSSIASDCKIVVPDALYDEWIAATNWSTYASNIVKASEYNG